MQGCRIVTIYQSHEKRVNPSEHRHEGDVHIFKGNFWSILPVTQEVNQK